MIRGLRDQVYVAFKKDALELIKAIHPSRSADELNRIVAALIAFIEGLHVIFDLGNDIFGSPAKLQSDLREQAYRLVKQYPALS